MQRPTDRCNNAGCLLALVCFIAICILMDCHSERAARKEAQARHDAGDIAGLIKALHANFPEERHASAEALAKCPDPDVVAALFEAYLEYGRTSISQASEDIPLAGIIESSLKEIGSLARCYLLEEVIGYASEERVLHALYLLSQQQLDSEAVSILLKSARRPRFAQEGPEARNALALQDALDLKRWHSEFCDTVHNTGVGPATVTINQSFGEAKGYGFPIQELVTSILAYFGLEGFESDGPKVDISLAVRCEPLSAKYVTVDRSGGRSWESTPLYTGARAEISVCLRFPDGNEAHWILSGAKEPLKQASWQYAERFTQPEDAPFEDALPLEGLAQFLLDSLCTWYDQQGLDSQSPREYCAVYGLRIRQAPGDDVQLQRIHAALKRAATRNDSRPPDDSLRPATDATTSSGLRMPVAAPAMAAVFAQP